MFGEKMCDIKTVVAKLERFTNGMGDEMRQAAKKSQLISCDIFLFTAENKPNFP